MGDTFDPTAMAAAQNAAAQNGGGGEGEQEEEEGPLDVHGAASAGRLPVTARHAEGEVDWSGFGMLVNSAACSL